MINKLENRLSQLVDILSLSLEKSGLYAPSHAVTQEESTPLLPQITYRPEVPGDRQNGKAVPNMRLLPQSQSHLRIRWINIVLETSRRNKNKEAKQKIAITRALCPESHEALPHTVIDLSPDPRCAEHYLEDLMPLQAGGVEQEKPVLGLNQLPNVVSYRAGESDQNFSLHFMQYQLPFNPRKEGLLTPKQLEILRFHLNELGAPAFVMLMEQDFEILSNAINTLKQQNKNIKLHHGLNPLEAQLLVFYHRIREQLIAPGKHYDKQSFLDHFDESYINLRLSTENSMNHLKYYAFILSKLYSELISHQLLVQID